MSGTRIIIRLQGKYAEILLQANQQRTVLILNLRHQIGYEGISLLAVGSWQLAEERKKIVPSFLFSLPSSLFLTSVTSVT
ncbi:hypothetical protein [Microcoleus sp. Pol12B5]|uniref:hypothetical protein n=1 Tax=Microcoleus sp. Pol12B5 TaxID=3055396 RepID=UPI002FD0D7A1